MLDLESAEAATSSGIAKRRWSTRWTYRRTHQRLPLALLELGRPELAFSSNASSFPLSFYSKHCAEVDANRPMTVWVVVLWQAWPARAVMVIVQTMTLSFPLAHRPSNYFFRKLFVKIAANIRKEWYFIFNKKKSQSRILLRRVSGNSQNFCQGCMWHVCN